MRREEVKRSLFATFLFLFLVVCAIFFINQKSSIPMSALESGPVVVVGGGLAGLSSALAAAKAGSPVILLEKERIGGNSAKATSGVNAVYSRAQIEGIKSKRFNDSIDSFVEDTLTSGKGLCQNELVNVLASFSGDTLDRLRDEYDLQMTDINWMGGASNPRCHRFPPSETGRPVPVGFTLVNRLKEAAKSHSNIQILEESEVLDFSVDLTDLRPKVTSVTYKSGNETKTSTTRALILAAGGFCADSSPSSVLAEVRPDLVGFPTTNGRFATGDLHKIAAAKNIDSVLMDMVQLHPTGFVDIRTPYAPQKFLCPEVMRGVGGILVDLQGKRFVNELLPRDTVSAAIREKGSSATEWGLIQTAEELNSKVQKTAMMVVTPEMAKKFGLANFNFYISRGLIHEINNWEQLQQLAKVDSKQLEQTLQEYDASVVQKKDEFGKTTFPSTFGNYTPTADAPFFVMFITPSLHYVCGGLKIDGDTRVVTKTGASFLNLFAAGEISAGVHGANRLGGNGCLESMVFGDVAGRIAANVPQDLSLKMARFEDRRMKFEVANAGKASSSDDFKITLRFGGDQMHSIVEKVPEISLVKWTPKVDSKVFEDLGVQELRNVSLCSSKGHHHEKKLGTFDVCMKEEVEMLKVRYGNHFSDLSTL